MDRWDDLTRSVASVVGQANPPDEIVVVIDHNDELAERADVELTDAKVLRSTGERGLSGARNTGVAMSSGEIIVFLDDDAAAEPNWLVHLLEPFDRPEVAGVGGWIVPAWDGGAPGWFPKEFLWIVGCSYRGLPAAGEELRNPIGANMALRRDVFDTSGGFTTGLGRIGRVPLGCEETELCIRHRARVADAVFVHAPRAVVHHRVGRERASWSYYWRRCWAEGISKAAVAKLVGPRDGLSSERRYVTRVLPTALWRSLVAAPSDGLEALGRGASIAGGAVVAAAGYGYGRARTRA
jgi:GT2 family glycosyltransferase